MLLHRHGQFCVSQLFLMLPQTPFLLTAGAELCLPLGGRRFRRGFRRKCHCDHPDVIFIGHGTVVLDISLIQAQRGPSLWVSPEEVVHHPRLVLSVEHDAHPLSEGTVRLRFDDQDRARTIEGLHPAAFPLHHDRVGPKARIVLRCREHLIRRQDHRDGRYGDKGFLASRRPDIEQTEADNEGEATGQQLLRFFAPALSNGFHAPCYG
jgi:hypothetical protein